MTDTVPLDAYERGEQAGPSLNGQRVPPHDRDVELTVIGACAVRPALLTDVLATGLTAADFYEPAHRRAFETIEAMATAGEPVDAQRLKVAGVDDRVLVSAIELGAETLLEHAPAKARDLIQLRRARDLQRDLDSAVHLAGRGLVDEAAEVMRSSLEPASARRPFSDDPTLDEFLDTDEPPYDWIVDDLLERGDRVIVTGEEGQGKSTLLRQLGVQTSAGIHPFTLEQIAPLNVLYVDCENSQRQARRALMPLRDAADMEFHGTPEPGRLRLRVLGHSMDLAHPEIYDDLARRIERYDTDLLIIGPIYKLIDDDPTKEVPARQVADVLDRLRQIRGTTLILEAHTPYSEGAKSKRPMRPYGASLWSRWPEFGLFLAPDGQLTHWRGQRDERTWPRKLTRAQPWPWAVDHNVPQEGETWNGPTRCIEATVEVLEELAGEELSTNQLVKALRERDRGYRNEVVSTAANQAADEGRIQRRNGPRGSVLFSANNDQQPIPEAF